MAVVQKRQNQQLAEGYVLITEDKALEYQMEIISEWPKFTEV